MGILNTTHYPLLHKLVFSFSLFFFFLSLLLFFFSSSPVYRIKEVKFTGGVAGATNFHNNAWRPEGAFMPQMPLHKGWHTGPSSGPAINLPVMIWYDFKADGVRPSEVIHIKRGVFNFISII